jgi:exonuclease SbcC
MKILSVALENIKSYEDRTKVPLQGGVTAVLGENGSGKSTIQEAIGFALFDSLPFNNNEFVREGASSGTVEVTIQMDEGEDGQQYRVTRSAGYSKYGVSRYNSESDEWVDQDIDSKKSLIQWLCTKFDLDTHGHKYVNTSGGLMLSSAARAASRSSSSVSNSRLPSS